VRVTSVTHPLFGRLLLATGFKRWKGEVLLVVGLPDGSPGTIRADATDILGGPAVAAGVTVLSVEGLRRLRGVVGVMAPAGKGSPGRRRANRLT
jgi:hypothetical protein